MRAGNSEDQPLGAWKEAHSSSLQGLSFLQHLSCPCADVSHWAYIGVCVKTPDKIA